MYERQRKPLSQRCSFKCHDMHYRHFTWIKMYIICIRTLICFFLLLSLHWISQWYYSNLQGFMYCAIYWIILTMINYLHIRSLQRICMFSWPLISKASVSFSDAKNFNVGNIFSFSEKSPCWPITKYLICTNQFGAQQYLHRKTFKPRRSCKSAYLFIFWK